MRGNTSNQRNTKIIALGNGNADAKMESEPMEVADEMREEVVKMKTSRKRKKMIAMEMPYQSYWKEEKEG